MFTYRALSTPSGTTSSENEVHMEVDLQPLPDEVIDSVVDDPRETLSIVGDQTVDKSVPAKKEPWNNTEANSSNEPLPIISLINIPLTSEVKPEEPTNRVNVLICAPDQKAAMKRCKQFQNSKMIGPHQTDLKHHFMFSTHLNDRSITKMKNDLNKFEDILMFRIVHENKKYHPDDDLKHHCEKCQSQYDFA